MNITEDYVSYEVAKLLEEKGFDEKTLSYYEDNVLCRGDWFEWNRSPLGHISAPTHQMAMKWLRKVHSLHIQINYMYGAYQEYDYVVINTFSGIRCHEPISFSSYEEAVEAALKYSLENLI